MSSSGFEPAIEIRLRPSRLLAGFLFLAHAAALMVTSLLPLGWHWKLALAAALIASFATSFRRHILRRGRFAVRRLVWTSDGRWRLTDARKQEYDVHLLPDFHVGPRLISLRFSRSRFKRYSIVLLPDSASRGELRRLRVRLNAELRR